STAGKRGMPRYAAYTASKFALVGFTQSVAHELGPHGVNVNAICPGLAETERAAFIADAIKPSGTTAEQQLRGMVADRTRANPLGRITETEDIAKMAAFLSSAESDYLTGLAVSVSGGDVMY
ncbi:MAG: SDR family oxidoreductase, partial [Chloroflexi bacterium]|nr:SDR family oxidoreductase [Chloroflexota bacterium]